MFLFLLLLVNVWRPCWIRAVPVCVFSHVKIKCIVGVRHGFLACDCKGFTKTRGVLLWNAFIYRHLFGSAKQQPAAQKNVQVLSLHVLK